MGMPRGGAPPGIPDMPRGGAPLGIPVMLGGCGNDPVAAGACIDGAGARIDGACACGGPFPGRLPLSTIGDPV
jgi:hypothetical protein